MEVHGFTVFGLRYSVTAERVPVDVVATFSDSYSPFFRVHRFFGGAAGFDLTCQH